MAYNPRQDTEETFQQDTGLPGSALPPGPGYVLDPNGKIVVGNDTYYPSTTNGKLDLFSKTVAVENPTAGVAGGEPMYSVSQHKWITSPVVKAPAPAAPAAQDSPFAVIDQQAGTLKQRFAEQFKRLQGQNLPPEQHNKILARMQADYDAEKYKLSDIRTQLDGIQSAIESGVVDLAMGQQTQWKLAAPHMAGAFKATQEPEGRMSPGEMTAFGKKFAESRDRAYVAPYFSENYYDPEKLKQEYLTDRAVYGYDTQMNTDEKKAFDIQWDAVIAAKPAADKVWKDLLANDLDLMTSRTYDSQLLDAAARKATGKRVSPFAQGVNTPAGTKTLDKATAAALLQEAGGDKNKARQIAKQRGYSF